MFYKNFMVFLSPSFLLSMLGYKIASDFLNLVVIYRIWTNFLFFMQNKEHLGDRGVIGELRVHTDKLMP